VGAFQSERVEETANERSEGALLGAPTKRARVPATAGRVRRGYPSPTPRDGLEVSAHLIRGKKKIPFSLAEWDRETVRDYQR
jgi:hypothetical protein